MPSQANVLADHGHQQGISALVEQLCVGERTGGDHAHDFAIDWALAGTHLAHLLADGD